MLKIIREKELLKAIKENVDIDGQMCGACKYFENVNDSDYCQLFQIKLEQEHIDELGL